MRPHLTAAPTRAVVAALLTAAVLVPAATAQVLLMPQKPGWTYLTFSDDTHVYVKDAVATPTGAIRKVWTLYDLPEKNEREGHVFMSVASLGEFDCERKTTRTIEEAYYEQPGMTGKPIERPPIVPTPWVEPSEGSVGAMKLEFACRVRPTAALEASLVLSEG